MTQYSKVAVEKAIQASRRSGQHIGKREAQAIHRLLAGRGAPRYGIWCEVWGGVTGSRSSWAKGPAGEVLEFASQEEAVVEAEARMARTQGDVRRTANFAYTAAELEP